MKQSSSPRTGIPENLYAAQNSHDIGQSANSKLTSAWDVVAGQKLHRRSSSRASGGDVPILFVHGLVISSLYMIPLANLLAEKHAVHALDLPGFGRSESPQHVLSISQLADSIVEWLCAVGIERCHLVANSMGCQIAAHVAVKAPEKVLSMVLIGPTIDPGAYSIAKQTLRLIRDAMHEPFSLWLKWIFDFFRAGMGRSFGTTKEMFRDRIEHQLPKVVAPTLVMSGGKDPTVPRSAARQMASLLRRSTLLTIEGEPHCVHYTSPSIVCEAIERHICAEVDGTGHSQGPAIQ